MRADFLKSTIIVSAVISAVNVVFNQLRKGEPRPLQAVVSGVVTGICIVGVLYWQSKKKKNAETSEPK